MAGRSTPFPLFPYFFSLESGKVVEDWKNILGACGPMQPLHLASPKYVAVEKRPSAFSIFKVLNRLSWVYLLILRATSFEFRGFYEEGEYIEPVVLVRYKDGRRSQGNPCSTQPDPAARSLSTAQPVWPDFDTPKSANFREKAPRKRQPQVSSFCIFGPFREDLLPTFLDPFFYFIF